MMIDLNCDLGEGQANDLKILPMVTSINIACCAHAGTPDEIRNLLSEAVKQHVRIGAHPGYMDREHFGRIELHQPVWQIESDLHFQLGGFMELARRADAQVCHLKPHGALYHRAMNDKGVADLLVQIAQWLKLDLVGMKNSELEKAAQGKVHFLREGFADRSYLPDGNLTPRSSPLAILHDPVQSARQVLGLIHEDSVQTVCVHGDAPGVVEYLTALILELKKLGIQIERKS